MGQTAFPYQSILDLPATQLAVGQGAGSGLTGLEVSAFVRTVLDDLDPGTFRSTIGLGTLATQSGTFSGTSANTNTGDQDLSAYLTSAAAASTYVTIASAQSITGVKTFAPAVSTSGSPNTFVITAAAHTTLTAATEATDVNVNLARTVQFSTGAITTQRAMRVQAPTYGFVGASVITTAATLAISGAPVAGTNATITNPYALSVENGKSYFAKNLRSDAVSVTSASAAAGADGVNYEMAYPGHGWATNSNGECVAMINSTGRVRLGFNVTLGSDLAVAWSSAINVGTNNTPDLYLYRDAAAIVAQRNGTTAQLSRIYNTFISATSFERGNFSWLSNVLTIGTEKGSAGGVARDLEIQTDGVTRLSVNGTTGIAAFIFPMSLAPYTFATVPSAGSHTGCGIRITDRAQRQAYSDGTNWRFVADDVIIS